MSIRYLIGTTITTVAITVLSFSVTSEIAHAAQDRYSVKAPNGVAFSEFKGYEDWQNVAVSQVEGGLKVIMANPTMIAAYRKGIPGNHKPFPDGSAVVKIEWSQKKNPESPYLAMIPDQLKSVSFIVKNSKRFPKSSGWGYAQFLYDPKSDAFKPFGTDASFNEQVCYACHTAVTAKDYIFTAYPKR